MSARTSHSRNGLVQTDASHCLTLRELKPSGVLEYQLVISVIVPPYFGVVGDVVVTGVVVLVLVVEVVVTAFVVVVVVIEVVVLLLVVVLLQEDSTSATTSKRLKPNQIIFLFTLSSSFLFWCNKNW